jgi:hypothetical protein
MKTLFKTIFLILFLAEVFPPGASSQRFMAGASENGQ